MTIEIEALDTLIFQDGKPFDKSSDNWSNSLVLPTPSTLYGALRSTYFANNPKDLSKANEKNDPTKNLKINFIAFLHENNLIFPMPKDCVKSNNQVITLNLKENLLTNNPLPYIFTANDEAENLDNSYLKKSNFKRYLSNKTIGTIESEENLIIKEGKIGIGLNKKTKTISEGLLYRVEMLRYKNLKIVVDFDNLKIENKGLMRLGGEGKGAIYKKIDSIEFPKIETLSSNRFKLYLLTPAIFENGWYPNWIDIFNNFIGEFNGFKLKLIAASIGKYQSIGGFDMKEKKPKEMIRAVPAGSVYYFEIIEGNKEKVIDYFHLKSISDKLQKEGYGIVIVGDVK